MKFLRAAFLAVFSCALTACNAAEQAKYQRPEYDPNYVSVNQDIYDAVNAEAEKLCLGKPFNGQMSRAAAQFETLQMMTAVARKARGEDPCKK